MTPWGHKLCGIALTNQPAQIHKVAVSLYHIIYKEAGFIQAAVSTCLIQLLLLTAADCYLRFLISKASSCTNPIKGISPTELKVTSGNIEYISLLRWRLMSRWSKVRRDFSTLQPEHQRLQLPNHEAVVDVPVQETVHGRPWCHGVKYGGYYDHTYNATPSAVVMEILCEDNPITW